MTEKRKWQLIALICWGPFFLSTLGSAAILIFDPPERAFEWSLSLLPGLTISLLITFFFGLPAVIKLDKIFERETQARKQYAIKQAFPGWTAMTVKA